jgi:plasmid stabilization system protein ParE
LVYLGEARSELSDAFEWYLERSPLAAQAFLAEIERAAVLILEAPEIWPRFERETQRYVLRKFPFGLIYRISGDTVQIIAVAHQKRRPGYWRSRRHE